MLSRKEVEYNIKALTETWLFSAKKSPDSFHVALIKDGDIGDGLDLKDIDNVNEYITDVLLGDMKYDTVRLLGVFGGEKEVIGELDII